MSQFLNQNDRYQYLSKFGCEQGKCVTKIQARFQKPIIHQTQAKYFILNVGIKTDMQQQKQNYNDSCFEKKKNEQFQDVDLIIQIPTNGEFSLSLDIKYDNIFFDREVMIYYYINDCQKYLESNYLLVEQQDYFNKDFQYNELEFKIYHLNSNFSNFSSEQTEIIEITFVLFIIQMILLLYNYRKYLLDKQLNLQTNYPLLGLNACLLIDCISHVLHLLHLIVFEFNGKGIIIFLVANNVFIILSQYVLNSIILFIGCGWTIGFMSIEKIDDMALPMVILFGILNMIVQSISHLNNEQRDSYHHYNEIALTFLFTYKIMFLAFFCQGILKQYKISKQCVQVFLLKFAFIGILMIAIQPILLILSYFVAVQYKFKFVVYGCQFIQILIMAILSYLFISKNSIYNKNNYKTDSILDQKFE